MPHEKTKENMRRYAEEVRPRVDAALPAPAEPAPQAVPFPEVA